MSRRGTVKQRRLESSVNYAMALLFLMVLMVWAVFALFTFRSMAAEAERNAGQLAGHAMAGLEEELLVLESVSFELSQSETASTFVSIKQPLEFHNRAPEVANYIDTLVGDSQFIDSLILYGGPDRYYRFSGAVSNTSAAKAYYSTEVAASPAYVAIPMEGIQYVGYAIGIFKEGQPVGKAVLLMEEGRILALLNEYTAGSGLEIALMAEGRVLTSPNELLAGNSAEELKSRYGNIISRRVGYTPFEIVVAWQSGYLSSGVMAFALTALFTVLLFGVLLVVYSRYTRRHFFAPMLSIMHGVQRMEDRFGKLPHYGEAEFDRLADTINGMVGRLEERSQALLGAQAKLQATEIERQQALIVSLKKQINAHFVVNVLNDVKILAEAGETEKAAEVSDGLSHLLRYANAEDEFIDGMEELFVLEKYTTIMGIRHGNAFSAEFDWDDRLGRVKMPRMLLQPLVENAIAHGLAARQADGVLKVSARLQGGMVHIAVEDNGMGMSGGELERVRRSIALADTPGWTAAGIQRVALANIRRRLQSYYPGGFQFEIESRTIWGTTVRLSFPDHTTA